MHAAPRFVRPLCLALALLELALAVGFALRLPAVTALWPWPDGRLTMIFAGSISAAMAAALVWIAWTQEWRLAAAGGLTVGVMSAGLAATFWRMVLVPSTRPPEMIHEPAVSAIVMTAVAVFSFALIPWGRRFPLRDTRPRPRIVGASYALFGTVLLVAGGALVAGLPEIMPWPLVPGTSALIGWIFLGDAAYYLQAAGRPTWRESTPQLLSFLAYDAVLLPPLALHLRTVPPELRLNLWIYLSVLVYSAALAVWFIFVDRRTRLAAQPAA